MQKGVVKNTEERRKRRILKRAATNWEALQSEFIGVLPELVLIENVVFPRWQIRAIEEEWCRRGIIR